MLDLDFISESLNGKSVRFGEAVNLPVEAFSIDSRTIQPNSCFVALPGKQFNGHDFIREAYQKGCRCFIAEKRSRVKVKKNLPEGFVFFVNDTVEALANLAHQYKNSIFATVIALTGSSGKTTTRELVVSLLSRKYNVHTAKKNFNNEIGLPLTILEAPSNTHVIVLEMGMNHAGEIKKLSEIAQPLLGMVTNIGYAHIGNFASLNAIADAKGEIFQGIMPHGFALLNRDDAFFEYLKCMSPVEVLDFGLSDITVVEDKVLDGYRLSYRDKSFLYPLPGSHNLSNLCGALKVAEFFKVDTGDCVQAIESSDAVSGRSEVIRNEITVINDCYNANPTSMTAGLELLGKSKGRKIAVLADMLELGKSAENLHRQVGDYIATTSAADYVLAYGDDSKFLVDEVKSKSSIPAFWFKTKDELLNQALTTVQKGDVVLIKASNGMKLQDAAKTLMNKF